jgi:Tol biopolymer transport system component
MHAGVLDSESQMTPRPNLVAALAIIIVLLAGETTLQGQEAQLVAPGIISTDGGEAFPALSPNGTALYFSTHGPGWSDHKLVLSHREPEGWGKPQALPFSDRYNDRAPRPSPDGSRLYFSSDRPLPGEAGSGDYNLWVVERRSGGEWDEPTPLPAPVNTERDEYHVVVTADGTLYYAGREWPGGYGKSDIYRATFDGQAYGQPENLGPSINDALSQPDLYISPDGRLMILAITDHPDGFGGDDLYVSYFQHGAWTAPENLGPRVNSDTYEYGPSISPDGRFLYFTSHRRGPGDIYRIAVSDLGIGPGH